MADGDTTSDSGGQSYAFGAGGDPYGGGFGLLGLLGGGRGMQDPYLAMLQPQLSYAQGLMARASDASPVASPWQAAARAVSGMLGGYEMGQYGKQYQQTLAGEVEQARRATQGALSGLDLGGGSSQGAGPTARQAPSGGPEQAADANALAALPDVKALPADIQAPLVQAMLSAKLGPNAGAQFARMIKAESGGQHFGASGNQLTTSPAGALGAAQVMPATFADMAKKYGISGDISDVNANLSAGAHYFADGLSASNGDLAGGAAYYNGGPKALATYQQGGTLPAETQRYLVATNATGSANAPAQSDVATNPQANLQAGWQAAMQLQLRLAQMASSPNPYVRAAVPQLAQVAGMLKTQGLWSVTGTDPANGQQMLRNNMTGEVKAVGAGLRPEGVAMSDLARLAPIAQADPNLLSAEDKQRLQTAITQIYQPQTKLDEKTGIQQTYWGKPPPAWVKTFMGLDDKGQPASTQPAPAQTVSQAEAERAAYDKRLDAANTYLTSLQSQADATRTLQGDTQAIRDIVSQIRTGWGAETQARARSMLAALGASDPDQITKAADAQAAEKMFLKLSFDAVRTLGAREPGSVISMTMQRFPSLESQPQAIQIMTRMLDMQQNYHEQRIAALHDWLANQTTTATTAGHRFSEFKGVGDFASTGWDKANMPKTYSAAALLAARMPDDVWKRGLTADQIDQAEQLAAQMYPTEITYTPPRK